MNQNFYLIDHPLVKRDLTILRDLNTDSESFRAALQRVSNILAVEISREFSLTATEVTTPLEKTVGSRLANDVILVPVLRAGLGMVNGFLQIIPEAKVGHIGLQRDEETLKPVEYYYKVPENLAQASVLILDPMLATGGSATEALKYLKNRGATKLFFASIVSSPEGVEKIRESYPEVRIFTAALDRGLNSKGYIVPGLGDAGDRTFGTL